MRQQLKNARFKKAAQAVIAANRLGLASEQVAQAETERQLDSKRAELVAVRKKVDKARFKRSATSIIDAKRMQFHAAAQQHEETKAELSDKQKQLTAIRGQLETARAKRVGNQRHKSPPGKFMS